jgi:hypothetical protein
VDRRELDAAELSSLRACKKKLDKILRLLRKCEVGSIMAFRITNDIEQAVNATQLAQISTKCVQEGSEKKVDEEGVSDTASLGRTLFDDPKSRRDSIITTKMNDPLVAHASTPASKPAPTTFKIYHLSEEDTIYDMNQIPSTQEEIKSYMSNTSATQLSGTIENILALPPAVCRRLLESIKWKNQESYSSTDYINSQWTVHSVITINAPAAKSRLPWKKNKPRKLGEYVVVLSRQEEALDESPTPSVDMRAIDTSTRDSSPEKIEDIWRGTRGNGDLISFQLTDLELENVINDFLASFSTLYDGVSVEDRGKALREIEIGEDYCDNDSSRRVKFVSGTNA